MVTPKNDEIARLFASSPNPFQTTKDFLSCIVWRLYRDYNAYIYPTYVLLNDYSTKKYYTGFYVIPTVAAEIIQRDYDEWFIRLMLKDGTVWLLPYNEIIHLKWRRGINEFFGGNDNGAPQREGLEPIVKCLHEVIRLTPKVIEDSMQSKFFMQGKGTIGFDALSKLRDDYEKHIFKAGKNVFVTDLSVDVTPLETKPVGIPKDILDFLQTSICQHYGVSMPILTGDYTGDQHAAFFQRTIEDFIVEFEQAFTSVLFTRRELDVGHKVKCYYNKILHYSIEQRLRLLETVTPYGAFTINDILETIGKPPIEGGDKYVKSLNTIDADIAAKYQAGKAGIEIEKQEKTNIKNVTIPE